MRTIFTSEDIKNIVENIFNGNLHDLRLSKGSISYENENSEKIYLVDEDDGTRTEKDLAEYLNIYFYNWKQRIVSEENNSELSVFDSFIQSLNNSFDKSYGLVEITDEEVVASQDIDSSTINGKITFLIQTNKVNNLEYYVNKIRNKYLGVAQDIQNSYGDIIKSYVLIGALMYDEEPITLQIGECIICSLNFRISYLGDAQSYNDTQIQISLDGDDLYDTEGNIVDAQGNPTESKYLTMPLTKTTWQNIFTMSAVTTALRPDQTGFISTALSMTKTLSFYDYNKELTNRFNELFWSLGAYRIDGQFQDVKDINIPVYLKVINKGHTYVYKDVIEQSEKVLTNSDFNICSLTLRGWGKVEREQGTGIVYKITFESEGEEEPVWVVGGTQIPTLPIPTKAGYTFKGWEIDGEIINTGDIWNYTDNKTAIATWEANTYTLNFNSMGGSEIESIQVTYGEPIGTLEEPIKSDFDFINWTIDGNEINEDTIWNYDDDKTAVANWNELEAGLYQNGELVMSWQEIEQQYPQACIGNTIRSDANNQSYFKDFVGDLILPKYAAIGDYGFADCSNLTSIKISDTFTEIRKYAFYNCTSLTHIEIPENVRTTGSNLFEGCSGLISVNMDNVYETELHLFTFKDCISLKNVTLHHNILVISQQAFDGCTALENITLPAHVDTIWTHTFDGCTSLKNITILADTPPKVQPIQTHDITLPETLQNIFVPSYSVNSYKIANAWSNYANIISAIPE